jgi:K+-sensing histidine kinase KdpD
MLSARWASAVAVSIAAICILTAILWYTGRIGVCPHDPVFFFLLPVTLVALRYGAAPAFLAILASFACADFFLYDPLYSFDICSRAELGDLGFFSMLAALAVKAASQLSRPLPTPPAKGNHPLIAITTDAFVRVAYRPIRSLVMVGPDNGDEDSLPRS